MARSDSFPGMRAVKKESKNILGKYKHINYFMINQLTERGADCRLSPFEFRTLSVANANPE